jgi:hypothetical protein
MVYESVRQQKENIIHQSADKMEEWKRTEEWAQ